MAVGMIKNMINYEALHAASPTVVELPAKLAASVDSLASLVALLTTDMGITADVESINAKLLASDEVHECFSFFNIFGIFQ